jgi:pyruvate carboxylase
MAVLAPYRQKTRAQLPGRCDVEPSRLDLILPRQPLWDSLGIFGNLLTDFNNVLLLTGLKAHYDSMLVKCSCHGSTYEIVRRKMLRALVEFRIRGVKTNIPFLASLLTHPTFIEGNCWTTFIDDT